MSVTIVGSNIVTGGVAEQTGQHESLILSCRTSAPAFALVEAQIRERRSEHAEPMRGTGPHDAY
jgi:hypothetical protein